MWWRAGLALLRALFALLILAYSVMGSAQAQTGLDSYNHSGLYKCWGSGRTVSVTNGPVQQVVDGVLDAMNSTDAECTNPGSYNNIYTFNRQADLTLWFNCPSVTDCGGQPVDNFSVALTCTANFTYSATAGGCLCNSGYGPGGSGTCTSNTVLGVAPSPSLYGQAVTLTATISGSTPTGTVTFKDGATSLGAAAVSSGVATLSASNLALGSHSLAASYGGDANHPQHIGRRVAHGLARSHELTATPAAASQGQNVTLAGKLNGS
jgi:hypothetical protein